MLVVVEYLSIIPGKVRDLFVGFTFNTNPQMGKFGNLWFTGKVYFTKKKLYYCYTVTAAKMQATEKTLSFNSISRYMMKMFLLQHGTLLISVKEPCRVIISKFKFCLQRLLSFF